MNFLLLHKFIFSITLTKGAAIESMRAQLENLYHEVPFFYANPNKSTANIFLVNKDFVPYICICEHPGFILNCLYREVLDNAWLSYKQQYGQNGFVDVNMNKRYYWHGINGR